MGKKHLYFFIFHLFHFSVPWDIDGETYAFPILWSIYTIGWESYGKKYTYYGKSRNLNFPSSSHMMGFVAFFPCPHHMENWWGNTCISHMVKYTIGWESNGKKAPILWEKYEYQFPRLSPYHGFCCTFPYCGILMGKSIHFLYDGIG